MRLRSLRQPFAEVKTAFRDALRDATTAFRDAMETGLTPSAFLVASCKMSNSNPDQHAAIKIQTSIATTTGGKMTTMPDVSATLSCAQAVFDVARIGPAAWERK